jgi:hypothetical protein
MFRIKKVLSYEQEARIARQVLSYEQERCSATSPLRKLEIQARLTATVILNRDEQRQKP